MISINSFAITKLITFDLTSKGKFNFFNIKIPLFATYRLS